ncbi:unnamed protein product, partial [Rotaria sp. Silwood2]
IDFIFLDGTPGTTHYYTFYGRIYCLNDSIVEFISTSPFRVQKGNIYQQSNYTWAIPVIWTLPNSQTGLQPFCIAAVDNNGQTSVQHCVMIAVGASNPYIITPTFVQSTASPLGTVMATQSRFSIQIQTTLPLRRTKLAGTYISIYPMDYGSLTYTIDCKYSPDVYFLNKTIVFFIQNPSWTLGATYYVAMTEGVATADQYCGVEAGSFSAGDLQYGIQRFHQQRPLPLQQPQQRHTQ